MSFIPSGNSQRNRSDAQGLTSDLILVDLDGKVQRSNISMISMCIDTLTVPVFPATSAPKKICGANLSKLESSIPESTDLFGMQCDQSFRVFFCFHCFTLAKIHLLKQPINSIKTADTSPKQRTKFSQMALAKLHRTRFAWFLSTRRCAETTVRNATNEKRCGCCLFSGCSQTANRSANGFIHIAASKWGLAVGDGGTKEAKHQQLGTSSETLNNGYIFSFFSVCTF